MNKITPFLWFDTRAEEAMNFYVDTFNGGPIFHFTEATSLYVECEDQKEVDYFWNKLSAVPESEQCGWLKDKYGLSWQIIPKQLGELMSDPDPVKSKRVINAML